MEIVTAWRNHIAFPFGVSQGTNRQGKAVRGNSKEINEISKDTLVNLLNISDETYNAAQSAVHQVERDEISSSSSSTE